VQLESTISQLQLLHAYLIAASPVLWPAAQSDPNPQEEIISGELLMETNGERGIARYLWLERTIQ